MKKAALQAVTIFAFVVSFLILSFAAAAADSAAPIKSFDEGDLVKIKVNAIDPDGRPLKISFTKPLNASGEWQTGYEDAGLYKAKIIVTNSENVSTEQEITILVNDKNRAPLIVKNDPEEMTQIIDEGTEIQFKITANDPDGDNVTYSWKLDNVEVSDNNAYSFYADYESSGRHSLKAEVSDGILTNFVVWYININNVDRSKILNTIKDIQIIEGETAALELPDFSKYHLRYTMTAPLINNSWKTTYGDGGVYTVQITAFDGSFMITKKAIVTVIKKYRNPVFDMASKFSVEEGSSIAITLNAVNPDGVGIAYSSKNLPEGAKIEGNVLRWAPKIDTIRVERFLLLRKDTKDFPITIVAKSNDLTTDFIIKITVKAKNKAPIIEANDIAVNEGEYVIINPNITDPEGDKVDVKLSGWLSAGRYNAKYTDAGKYTVTINATDEFGAWAAKNIFVTVSDVNQIPKFTNPLKKLVLKENKPLTMQIDAVDPDKEDSVNIIALNLPIGAVFKNNTLTWTPGFDSVNRADEEEKGIIQRIKNFISSPKKAQINITFIASDKKSETKQSLLIEIGDVNRAPEIIAYDPLNESMAALTNKQLKFQINATDSDSDLLTYTWHYSSWKKTEGQSTFRITYLKPGKKEVKVVVSDGKNSAEKKWIIDVKQAAVKKAATAAKPAAKKTTTTTKKAATVPKTQTTAKPAGKYVTYTV